MRTKTESRRFRLTALREVRRNEPAAHLFDEEEPVPSSAHVVMDQASELPALMEYLRECGSRTIH